MRPASFWTAVLLSVAALLGGGAYAIAEYRADAGPQAAVTGYFAALARGDAPAALALGTVPPGPHGFLTSAVLAEQQRIAPLRAVRITAVSGSGSRAVVRFSYALGFATGSRTISGSVAVDRSRGVWRLARAAVATTVRIDQAADRLSFAGTSVPEGRTLLFPGALPARFDTPYLSLAPSTADARFGVSDTAVRVDASAAAQKQLSAALDGKLRSCVSAPPPGADCPLPSPQYVPGSLRGRVTELRLTWRVSSDAAGSIYTTGSAVFIGSYRRLTYDNLPESKQGRVQLPIAATASAVAPLLVRWSS